MIGLYLLFIGVGVILFLVSPPSRGLVEMRYAHLLLHEVVVLLFSMGFWLAIQESNDPFLLASFPNVWIYAIPWTFPMLSILYWNSRRFSVQDPHAEMLKVLVETARNATTLEEGIDHVIQYLDERQYDFQDVTSEVFLRHLSKQGGRLEEIAKQKLHDIAS